MSRLHDATIEALEQIRSLIVSVAKASGRSGNLYVESAIGPHVRHVADHFRAFQAGTRTGVVNYNARRRECALERRSDLARLEIENIISWLRSTTVTETPLSIESEISCLHTKNARFQSNTSRELLYLINHTIHHAAYAALLARQHGVSSDASIGYAPATASYLRDSGANQKESRPRQVLELPLSRSSLAT